MQGVAAMEGEMVAASGTLESDVPVQFGLPSAGWWASPWVPLLGGAAGVLGLVLLLIAYVNVADSTAVELQVPYIVSGGIGGLFALGVGATLVLVRELRLDNERLRNVEEGVLAVEDNVATLGEAVEDVLTKLEAAVAQFTNRVDERVR